MSERTCQLQKSSRLAEERADEIADLYNHAPCGYHSLDPFGRFQKINDTELTWLGYTRDEVIGRMGFSDLLSADQNLRFQANFSQLITQGYLKDMDYELRRKDGRTIPVLVSATALRDQSGTFLMSRSVVYNLTEIKEAERAASRHAQLAEAFFRHSVACLVILDRDYHVLRVNNAYARACRRHVEDFVGCEYFALYPSESKVIFDEVVRTKRPFAAFNSAFAFADQPERGVTYWDWTLVPILGQDGEIEYLVFSLNDVTERKRAEEALRESERFIRTIAGNLPGMVGYWDTDLRCRFANHHYLEWFGKTSEQMIGITIQELMGETLFAQNEPFIRGVLRGEEQTFERTLIKQNGDPGFTLARYIPDRNEQGLVTGFFVLVTDITAIKHSEQRLMEITAALGEGLQMIDERGHVVFSNPAASRLLGWSEAEMLGAPGHQLMHAHRPDGSPYLREESPLYQAFVSEGTLIDHEDVFWTKDGRLLPVSVTLTTIRRHRHKAGAVVAFQDITRRKQAEAELQRYRDSLETMVQERTAALSESNEQLAIAKDLAETANRAKSTFLSNMSHELRTPLSAILGFAQLLEMAPDGRSDRDELCISHIISSGKHLLALINDILDLSKIDAGHLTVTSERVVTSKIIRNLHGALLPLAATVGVPVRVHLIEDLPDAWADLTRLNQVLLNLGSNAIKYNRPGGRVDIIAELPNPDFLRLTVADTGPGIPVERQKDLFKPFNRLGREAGPIEGTGIGLVLSRRLVRLMGGSMGFTSVPDEGSRFWIDIPVYAPEREANGEDAGSAQAREEKKRKIIDDGPRTILCVDDNVTGLELVAKIFARIPGTHLLTAGTAEAGIELAKRHHPDIILMDIMLPAMDGISALTELRRHPETKDIPVFALSAAATPSDMDKGLTAGFVRYLTKPYDVHELVAAVIDTLNKTSRGP